MGKAGEGTFMAIERDPATDGASALYRMIVINSASISTRQGTVIGYLTPTSDETAMTHASTLPYPTTTDGSYAPRAT